MPALGINATWGQQEWANFVLEHLVEQSALLRAGARFIPVNGRVIHIPRTLLDGQAAWVAELAEIPSDSPTGDELVLTPKKTGNVLTLSTESVEDAPVSELDAVGNALTASVARNIDVTALGTTAVTATAPAGLLAAAYSVPSQTGGVGSLDSYIRAMGTIEGIGGRATVIFINPADLVTLRLIKAATGSNEYALQPDPTQPGASQLNGARLISTSAIAAATALVCDPQQIVVAVRRDVNVEFSGENKFTSDALVAKVTARFDWGWGDIRGAVLVKV